MYILSKKYRELIIQKARLKRLPKTFLPLSWHHCPLYRRGVRAQSVIYFVHSARCCQFISSVFCDFSNRQDYQTKNFLELCIANGISCAESLKILQETYGESTLLKTRTYEWWRGLKSGLDVVKDLPRFGQPSTSSNEVNIAKVKEMVT